MYTVQLKDIVLGEGIPKICISITGRTEEEIYREAEALKVLPIDIVEWRVDWFEGGLDIEQVLHVLPQLQYILGAHPLIFTIRTKEEGGEKAYTPELYKVMNRAAIQSGYVDMVDVEIFRGDEITRELIKEAHRGGCKIIASNHEFHMTPSKEEIISRLMQMQNLGADVLKVAVMPQTSKDVLTLLEATREMVEEKATCPVVTMSMSSLGMVSRVSGEIFGSAMTFGAGEMASAPGQIPAMELSKILKILKK